MASGPYALNRQAKAIAWPVGHLRTPILIIDDFLQSPQVLIDHAAGLTYRPSARTLYPGVNGDLGPDIAMPFVMALAPLIERLYGRRLDTHFDGKGFFGLVTTPSEALTAPQSLPHYDSPNPETIAILLYLCGPEQGGTGFYRHRATGLERIGLADERAYLEAVTPGPASGRYFEDSDTQFERIGKVDAQVNRLIAYPSNLLHSGIVDPSRLSSDPSQGRLTANIFIL